MSIQYEDRVTLGTVIQCVTIIGASAAFIFRKYFVSENTAREVENQAEIITTQTKLQAEIQMIQGKQQVLIDGHERRIGVLEDRQWSAGRDFGERHPRGDRERDWEPKR